MNPMRVGSGTLISLLCIWTWLSPLHAAQSPADTSIPAGLVASGGYLVSSNGSIINQHNIHTSFIPASIIKIATSLVALECLGPSHHFTTEFYLDSNATLYIKGYGDPFLTSEYIKDIAHSLKERGIKQIKGITIDDSTYRLASSAEGAEGSDNPYDAPNGGLAVNFNSLALRVSSDGAVFSGEPQTPLLPLSKSIGMQLEPGNHRINVSAFPSSGEVNNSLRYTGELFNAFFTSAGILTSGDIKPGLVDRNCRLIYTFTSPKSVMDLVKDCLKFSNNFIANQLFLSCGIKMFGYPATWEKGIHAMYTTLERDFGIDCRGMKIYEGSGLSRRTSVSPYFMSTILEMFRPFRHLLPLRDSISIKSGTLTDVYCYAGYFISNDRADPFVIMLNQTENTRERVLMTLYQNYKKTLRNNSAIRK